MVKESSLIEIRWHGRGGQGAVTSTEMLAQAAISEGKYAQAFPSFGPERRGAPLTASTRISNDPIRTFAQIEMADIAVVLDSSLLKIVNIVGSVKKGGLIIINTPLKADEVTLDGGLLIATVDAVGIALRHRLIREGAPIVNTPLLGAFSMASKLVSLEYIERGLKWKLAGAGAMANLSALKDAYEETSVQTL